MMALCNQPEACASDLGDDQSHYLYHRLHGFFGCFWFSHAQLFLVFSFLFHFFLVFDVMC